MQNYSDFQTAFFKYSKSSKTKCKVQYCHLIFVAGSGDQSARQRGGVGQDLPDDDSVGYQVPVY